MDTAPHQLRQDLRLLDLFESLPAPSEPDSAALRQRLTDLCASQALEASPERVDQAVQRFLNQRSAPQPFERWKRPADHAEWTALLATLNAGMEDRKITKRERRWLVWSSGAVVLLTGAAFFITHLSQAHARDGDAGVFVLCLMSVLSGALVGLGLGFVALLGLESKKERLSTVKQGRACWSEWNPKKHELSCSTDLWFLTPHKPRAQEMARWLSVPECVEALQHIARSGVPLLGLDAVRLERLVKDHEARHRQAQDDLVAQQWEACTGLPVG